MRKLEPVLGVLGLGDVKARLLDTLDTAGICELSELRQTTTTAVEILSKASTGPQTY